MHQSAALSPDPDAEHLARQMLAETETMRTILAETIAAAEAGRATESGRTACGSAANTLAPHARFPAAIELQACPVDRTGTWHSHPSAGGLARPTHSLPDVANVVFEGVDASVVVGTESSEVLVRAADREAMAGAFTDALGMDVTSTREVERARGTQVPDPSAARERVRRRLGPLVRRERTPFPGLRERAAAVDGAALLAAAGGDAIACGLVAGQGRGRARAHAHTHPDTPTRALHRRAERCGSIVPSQPAGVDLSNLVVATVVGNIVGEITNRVLFGE